MKRHHRNWVIAAACLLGLPTPSYAQTNLLDNPGFENAFADDGAAKGWQKYPVRGKCVGTLAPGGKGRTGRGSQLLDVRETMDGWVLCSAPIRGGLVQGKDYEARIWLKGDRQLHNVALAVHNDKHWFPEDYANMGCNVGGEWKEFSMRFRAPQTAEKAFFAVRLVQEGKVRIDDASVRELPPPIAKTPTPGNLVRNGSFEVGAAGWVPKMLISKIVDDAKAPHGLRALQFSAFNGGDLSTYLMKTDSAQKYTFSVHLRSDRPIRLKTLIRSGYEGPRPAGPEIVMTGPETVAAVAEWDLTTDWKRYDVTALLPPTPNNAYYITMRPPTGVAVYADGAQFEHGAQATAFQPRNPIEAGLTIDTEDRIFAPGKSVKADLQIWNNAGRETVTPLHARTKDLWERVVQERRLLTRVPAGYSKLTVDVTPRGKTGAFRAEIGGVDALAPPTAEAVFAVIPTAKNLNSLTSVIGTHIDFTNPILAKAAGARWTKTWLPAWETVEPAPGVWKFDCDGKIQEWKKADIRVLAVLGGPPVREQDRDDPPIPWGWYPCKDYSRMTDYAFRVAQRYRNNIQYWEMTNEPTGGFHNGKVKSQPKAYAQMWRALALGVKKADPNAKIVAGSMTMVIHPEKWIGEVLDADPDLINFCDVVSYHNYSSDPDSIERYTTRLRAEFQRRGNGKSVAIWDTEWSPIGTIAPFYRDAPRNLSVHYASAHRATSLVVQGIVARIGAGIERSFLYQGYGSSAMDRYEFDVVTELGGGPRPIVAAERILANMIDGAKFQRRDPIPGCHAYRFRQPDGKALLILWSRDTELAPVPLKLAGQWNAFDMMGNAVAVPTAVTTDPIYLIAR